MRLTGWFLVILGLLGTVGTMLVAVIDVGVRDQYFADTGTSPWYVAVNVWFAASSIFFCVLGVLLIRRGR